MFKRTAAVLLHRLLSRQASCFHKHRPTRLNSRSASLKARSRCFRITVVGRTTPAINYRPRRGDTKVDFKGTALMPQAVGEAKVSGEQGYMNVEAKFDKFASASSFGSEYLTYVLWAVTPEGRATNLGEVQISGDDAEIKVTTELQAFGLIVTAEPYFAVTQPSDVVVMENVVRAGTEGSVEVIQAKYELLKRGSYLMNQDASKLKLKPLEPGSPLDLAQARNAVELARLAGADRFAEETFNKAAGLLATAETAREKRQGGNAVMQPARQAAQTAEDARLIGLQRQEESFVAAEKARVLAREQNALNLAQAEAARSRQAELDAQAARTARDLAERQAQTDAAARAAAELSARTAAAGQATAERATAECGRRAFSGGDRPRAGSGCAAGSGGADTTGTGRRGAVRAGQDGPARAAPDAAERHPRDARDGPRPDRQPLRRVIRHRKLEPQAGGAGEAGTRVGHPRLARRAATRGRGAHGQRRYGRLQPGALGTARGIGARVSRGSEVHGNLGRRNRLW